MSNQDTPLSHSSRSVCWGLPSPLLPTLPSLPDPSSLSLFPSHPFLDPHLSFLSASSLALVYEHRHNLCLTLGTLSFTHLSLNSHSLVFAQGSCPRIASLTPAHLALAHIAPDHSLHLDLCPAPSPDPPKDWKPVPYHEETVAQGVAGACIASSPSGSLLACVYETHNHHLVLRIATVLYSEDRAALSWKTHIAPDSEALVDLGRGTSPSVSVSDGGHVLVVFRSLSRRVASIKGKFNSTTGTTVLSPLQEHEHGASPAVCLVGEEDALCVYESSGQVQHMAGQVSDGRVVWTRTTPAQPLHGHHPALAVKGDTLALVSQTSHALQANASLYIDRMRWLENSPYLWDKHLYQFCMPGTHDAGTYSLTTHRSTFIDAPAFLPGFVTRRFGIVQDESIYQQLCGGVRFLDLRPACVNGSYYIHHDCIGPSLDDILTQVATFCSQVSKEIVVLQFGNFCGFTDPKDHQTLIDLIISKIGRFLRTNGEQYLTKTVDELTSQGPCVVVGYCDDFVRYNPHPGFTNRLKIFNNYSFTDDFKTMHDDQLRKMSQYSGEGNRLFVLAWQMTFTSIKTLRFGLSMKGLCSTANAMLPQFVAEHAHLYSVNILHTDFYEQGRPLDLSVSMNRARHSS